MSTTLRPTPSWLVTGATGFLGGHVLDALATLSVKASCYVLVRNQADWDRHPTSKRHPHLTPITGALLEPGRWSPMPETLDGIIHLAALVRHSRTAADEVFQVNVEGTRNMVELAARHRARMVLVSTSGTVACSRSLNDAPVEDAPYQSHIRRWPYYASKVQAEQAARYVAQHHDVPLVILRPPAILGPGDARGRATGLIRQFLAKKLPFLLSGGTNICDVRDVAQAIVRAAMHPTPRPIYHLPGHAESLADFFARLTRLCGQAGPRLTVPYALAWPTAWATYALGQRLWGTPLPPRVDPVLIEMGRHHWNIASRFAHSELKYSPRAIDATLTDTLDSLAGVSLGP